MGLEEEYNFYHFNPDALGRSVDFPRRTKVFAYYHWKIKNKTQLYAHDGHLKLQAVK